MSDGILSQDEIDALLGGGRRQEAEENGDDFDVQTIGEILRLAMSQTAESLAIMTGEEGRVEAKELRILTLDQLREFFATPRVLVESELRGGADGVVFTLFSPEAMELLGAISRGEEVADAQTDALPSGIGEIVSQFSLQLSDALTSALGVSVDTGATPPAQIEWDGEDEPPLPIGDDEEVVFADFRLAIGEASCTIAHLIPADVAAWMHDALERQAAAEQSEELAAAHDVAFAGAQTPGVGMGARLGATKRRTPSGAEISSASFAPLGLDRHPSKLGNIDLLLDVPLQVTVELGRTRMQIREVLELGKGSIVELEKLAGEPVEVYVNGKLIAKGEVVTIDENFGVKITDIVSRKERVSNLQ